MRIFKNTSVYLLVLLLTRFIFAQFYNAGSVNYQHLLLTNDARSAGMGGAGIALPGGIEMLTTNPAAIAAEPGTHAFVGYQNIGLGVWGSVLSFSRRYQFGTIGISLQGLSSGDVKEIRSINGLPEITDRIAHDEYLTPAVSFSRLFLNDKLLAGVAVKGMYQRIDAIYEVLSSKAIGFDIGVQYREFNNRLTAAAVFRNVGYEFSSFYNDDTYPTPVIFEAGVSYVPRYLPHIRIVADVNKSRGAYVMYEPGIEFEIYPGVLTARMGYAFSQRDLDEQMKSFSGEKDEAYVKSNLNTFACGIGVQTVIQRKDVTFDIALQLKDEYYPPNVVASTSVAF